MLMLALCRVACPCLSWSPSLRLEREEADPALPAASSLLQPPSFAAWATAPRLRG